MLELGHLAVKDTFLRRSLTLLALKTIARFRPWDGPCVPISKDLVIKTNPWVHLTEAATMEFVAANTSLPVPRVHCAFVHKNCAVIVMERMKGKAIPCVWNDLADDGREKIYAQLRRMMDELRSLRPPEGTRVESCVGGSLRDSRIPHCRPRFGPFETIQEFHSWLREDLNPDHHPIHPRHLSDEEWEDIKSMVLRHDKDWPPPVFTHGDLNPSNIIVDGDQVTGIIDWEFAGWYPYYWEYTASFYGNETRKPWQRILTKFPDAHPEDLEMDIIRQKWRGDL